MMDIVAVVVTYNRLALLKQCIECLLNQRGVNCDVLVVDNASTDGTDEYLQKLQSANPRVHRHNPGENLGGAGGFNIGIRLAAEAGYKWIWIMDDDTMPEPDALSKLMAADAQLGGRYGWLSSRTLWSDGSLCKMNIQRQTPYKELPAEAFLQPLAVAQMASFVSLLIPAQTICRFGLPIKEFFIWTDDWEYTRRISRELPCHVASESVVVHAMTSNTTSDLSMDSDDRIARYKYAFRNDVFLYRREGIKGWLWLLLKNIWNTAKVLLRCKKGRWNRIKVIWSSFAKGTSFKPAIEHIGEDGGL